MSIGDPIPEIPLKMLLNTEEAKSFAKFRWCDHTPNHKIGGKPDWINDTNEIPSCQSCEEPMAFLAQIDSIGDQFCFGDVGMIYVFMCRQCGETKVEMDCS
jgi:uncharacterized protein YwqG